MGFQQWVYYNITNQLMISLIYLLYEWKFLDILSCDVKKIGILNNMKDKMFLWVVALKPET